MSIKHLKILQSWQELQVHKLSKSHHSYTLIHSTCWYENIIYSALQWGEKDYPQTPGHPKGLFYCVLTRLAFLSLLGWRGLKIGKKTGARPQSVLPDPEDLEQYCWAVSPIVSQPWTRRRVMGWIIPRFLTCRSLWHTLTAQAALRTVQGDAALVSWRGRSSRVAAVSGAGPWGQGWGRVLEQHRECAYSSLFRG